MDDLHRQRRRDLTEEERETIRDLIIEQTRLLTTIAGDPTLVDDQAEREYRERHNALSSRLIPLGLRCFCVSGSIVPWQYSPHPELETEFNLMQAPFAEILGGPGPRWRLVLYRRDGDPDDLRSWRTSWNRLARRPSTCSTRRWSGSWRCMAPT